MKATQIYCGQYKRNSDFFRVWEIETQGESKEDVLNFCRENLYKKDIPTSAEWHTNIRYDGEKYNDMSYYFNGYYQLTETKNGYRFTVCEPYEKMTYEEALKYSNDVMDATIEYDESLDYQLTSYDLDWIDKAREAFRKQIPKKPTYFNDHGDIYFDWRCPNCGREFVNSTIGLNHCCDCGQAIDWSER